MRLMFAALPVLAIAGCATPETRVRTALMEAGISRPVASCMAQRMVDRLSLAQLQKLSRLSGMSRTQIGQLSVGELLRRARALGDPEIVSVVTTAGVGCAIAA
jgi:predicted Zn-dependent protease